MMRPMDMSPYSIVLVRENKKTIKEPVGQMTSSVKEEIYDTLFKLYEGI